MASKVDPKVFERILYLHRQGLTQEVIATRLGLSTRTVRVYLRADRLKLRPYEAPVVSPQHS